MIKKFKVHFILKFTEKNVDRAHKKKKNAEVWQKYFKNENWRF